MDKDFAFQLYKDMLNDLAEMQKDVYYPDIDTIDLNCYDDKRQRYELIIKLTKHSLVTFDELQYLRDNWRLQSFDLEVDVDVVKEPLHKNTSILTQRPYFKIIVS